MSVNYVVVDVTQEHPRSVPQSLVGFCNAAAAEAWRRTLAAGRPDRSFAVYVAAQPLPWIR